MIDKVRATINMRKAGHFFLAIWRVGRRHVHKIGRHDVEIPSIELKLGLQICKAKTIVSKL